MLTRLLIPVLSIGLMTAVTIACEQPLDSSVQQEVTPTPASYFDGVITLKLIAPQEARQWEQITGLDVVMTNRGQEPFTFWFGSNLLLVTIFDGQGKELWRPLGAFPLWLSSYTLEPGESRPLSSLNNKLFPVQWDLRDLEGFPVGPGEYKIKGIVTLWFQDPSPGSTKELWETSAHTLTITGTPMPQYAQGIKIELTAPSEARAGEPLPMDLRITNTSDKPVILWWSGDKVSPKPNDMDIVIFQEDKPIWRATSAHGVQYQGTITLGPGESQSMSGMSFRATNSRYKSSGDPWVWDQVAACGDYPRFEPCQDPVEPGTYTIRGVVNVSPPETLEQEPPFIAERTTIATEPMELVITP